MRFVVKLLRISKALLKIRVLRVIAKKKKKKNEGESKLL